MVRHSTVTGIIKRLRDLSEKSGMMSGPGLVLVWSFDPHGVYPATGFLLLAYGRSKVPWKVLARIYQFSSILMYRQ